MFFFLDCSRVSFVFSVCIRNPLVFVLSVSGPGGGERSSGAVCFVRVRALGSTRLFLVNATTRQPDQSHLCAVTGAANGWRFPHAPPPRRCHFVELRAGRRVTFTVCETHEPVIGFVRPWTRPPVHRSASRRCITGARIRGACRESSRESWCRLPSTSFSSPQDRTDTPRQTGGAPHQRMIPLMDARARCNRDFLTSQEELGRATPTVLNVSTHSRAKVPHRIPVARTSVAVRCTRGAVVGTTCVQLC